MKLLKPCFLLLVIVLFSLSPHSTGFITEENKITVYNLRSTSLTITEGDIVEISMYIKNFANFTLTNATVIQRYTGDFDLLTSPLGDFNGTDMYYNTSDNIEVLEELSQTNLPLYAMNITSSNFTMTFPIIPSNASYLFKFTLNATEEGTGTIDPPTITYLDDYLDEQNYASDYSFEFTITATPTYALHGYFPDVETSDIDWVTVMLFGVGILLVGLVGRMLYFKKPFDI